MTLPRQEVVTGLVEEYVRFEELLRSLDESEWQKATRCEGWDVAGVAAHVVGQLDDAVSGRLDGLGTPEVTAREVEERRGRTATELADELAAVRQAGEAVLGAFDDEAWAGPVPGGGFDITLGEGIEAFWYDAYVHADDIRAAVGRPSAGGPGLRASVRHLADLLTTGGWGGATLALDGLEEVAVSGGGRRVTGDPLQFVLVATGRADPASLGLDETVNVYR